MKSPRYTLVFVMLLFVPGLTHAQQISPAAEEYGKGYAKGYFTVSNLGVRPLTVNVDAQDMTVTENGHPVLSPASTTVHFKAPQFKLGPHAVYMVPFEAKCGAGEESCHFVVLASFSPLDDQTGLTVVEKLGSSVYICQKQKDCRKNTIARLNFPAPQN